MKITFQSIPGYIYNSNYFRILYNHFGDLQYYDPFYSLYENCTHSYRSLNIDDRDRFKYFCERLCLFAREHSHNGKEFQFLL